MSKKSSRGVFFLLRHSAHSRRRRNTMPDTDLSYYKLGGFASEFKSFKTADLDL